MAPSAVPIPDLMTMTAQGKPRRMRRRGALETNEIAGVIESFRQGAANALEAGFDGVEIHGANGYLIEQFLQSHTNLRTDQYGGSIANRARLLLEITQAVIEVWGANRVGVRLSPYGIANGSGEADPMPLYSHVIAALDTLGWPICISSSRARAAPAGPRSTIRTCRRRWRCSGRSGVEC